MSTLATSDGCRDPDSYDVRASGFVAPTENTVPDCQVKVVPPVAAAASTATSQSRSKAINSISPTSQVSKLGVEGLANFLNGDGRSHTLVIDVRPYTLYAAAHVEGAISICIPTTLLKRTTFGFQHIVEFVAQKDAVALQRLSEYENIVLYDAVSTSSVPDMPLFRTARKFDAVSRAKLYFVDGGIADIQRLHPGLVTTASLDPTGYDTLAEPKSPFNLKPVLTTRSPLLSSASSAVSSPMSGRPLDESTRIEVPAAIAERLDMFPPWIRNVVEQTGNGHNVLAENFQLIEAMEHARLHGSYRQSGSSPVKGSNGSNSPLTSRLLRSPRSPYMKPPSTSTFVSKSPSIQFELCPGNDPYKNRYINICPYTYNRVRLQNREPSVDYINASYVALPHIPLRYIATQAPVPSAFNDFWRCVWDHRSPLILMLTALYTESGQIKSHKYWTPGRYGDFELSIVEQGTIEAGYILRKFRLKAPCGDTHDVTQIHYEKWPDLGCPADPNDLLRLVELKTQHMQGHPDDSHVIVHCSAGCGRTGTLCTVDAVTYFLMHENKDEMSRDNVDRVFEAVQSLREQRLAMVQNQRQLRLCYTAVILWLWQHISKA